MRNFFIFFFLISFFSCSNDLVEKRNIKFERRITTEYLERIAESYSNYFHNNHSSNVLIVNNQDLDILEDKSALEMLIERINQISSVREYFNPKLI